MTNVILETEFHESVITSRFWSKLSQTTVIAKVVMVNGKWLVLLQHIIKSRGPQIASQYVQTFTHTFIH